MIKQLTGKSDSIIFGIKPFHGPERVGDIPHSQASIEKAQRLLGYKPTHSVREGMEEAIEWYRHNL
jgi:UDP-N-acetylglucosamine 4-epimerase